MFRRALLASVAAVLFALSAPLTAQAQSIYVLAGPTFPTGDFADFANTGWFAAGGVTFPVGENGLWVGFEGSYGINNHDVDAPAEFFVQDGDKTNLLGAMALLGYNIQTEGSVNPFIWGGAGLLAHRFVPEVGDNETDTNFGYQFGAGLSFGGDDSNVHPFVEARLEGSKESKFVAAEGGLSFGIGN